MVKNPRKKGFRNERKCVDELEKNGWLTYRVKGSTKFNKNVDIFGLWDILAIKPYLFVGKTRMRLIQVKSNQKPSLVKFRAFKKKYPDFECEIWIYKDRVKDPEVIKL